MENEVQTESDVAAASSPAPSMALNAVYSVSATPEANVFVFRCNITDFEGETYDCDYCSRPNDPHGLNPAFRRWLEESADFPITAYVPLTAEEVRAGMPPLTARQFRLGLVNAGISPSTVTATIAALPAGADRDKAQIEWEFATTFNRMHPLIATVGAALGLTDVQIDAMWTAAVSL